jgi:hypothetical protein
MTHALFIAVGLAAGFHVCTYGRWLWRGGNIPGGLLVYTLAAVTVVLPIYHMMAK